MNTTSLIVALIILGACAYTLPTAPVPGETASARPPITFSISALPTADRGSALITLYARAEDGAWADLDATCSASTGVFEFPRARSPQPAALTLRGAGVPTRISCITDNGLTAAAVVDLSAWELQISGVEEVARGRITRLDLQILSYGTPPALTSAVVDWGDGTVEPWLGETVIGHFRTFEHAYAGPGSFTVKPRVTWSAGGQAQRTILLNRTCSSGTCMTTWRTP